MSGAFLTTRHLHGALKRPRRKNASLMKATDTSRKKADSAVTSGA